MIKLYNNSDESMTLPLTMTWDTISRGRRVPIVNLLAGGGALAGTEEQEVRQFSMEGIVYYEDFSTMRTFLDDLLVFLEDSPVRLYQDEADSRFIYARCTGVEDQWLYGRKELQLTVSFIAGDPYFYSDEHTDTQTFTTATKEFNLYVGGNQATYPTIFMNFNSGTINNLKIENVTTGASISFNQGIVEDIMIDNKNLMVLTSSASLLSYVDYDWLLNSLKLIAGTNSIKVTGEGTYDFEIVTKWRSKWL